MRSIPSEFEMMGHTIEVQMSETLVEDTGAYGISHFTKNLIVLQTPTREVSMSFIVQTFFHEVAHFIMFYMGEHKLNDNEKFIDVLGNCIYQVMRTKRGKASRV